MKLSIIIPVYNKEQWLDQCIQSILTNKITDWECILINDCSTDGSLKILQQYAQQDSRFKIINFTKNQGVSAARNAGLDSAQGDWIGFLDADDTIHPDRYSKTIELAESLNLPVCGCAIEVRDSGKTLKFWHRIMGDGNTVYSVNKDLYIKADISGVVNIIYKKDLIGTTRFRSCNYAEDLIFNQELMVKYTKFAWCGTPLYYYNRSGSFLSKSPSRQTLSQTMKCWRAMIYETNNPYRKRLYINLRIRRFFRKYDISRL